jgi:WD40 repeat protein
MNFDFKNTVSTVDSYNWKVDCEDFILDIISYKDTNELFSISSNGSIYLLNRETGDVLKQVNLPVDIVFFADKNLVNEIIIVGTDKGFFSIDQKLNLKHFHKSNSWAEKGKWNEKGDVFFGSIGKKLFIFSLLNDDFELVKEDTSFESSISAIICKDNSFIVSSYGGVRLYSVDNQLSYQNFPWKTSLLELSWSPDKKYISSGTQENAVHFWPFPFKEEQDFEISGYESKITHLCWSENSNYLAINGGEDVCIWPFIEGPPFGLKPQVLNGGKGKVTTLYYKTETVIAGTEQGYILSFFPSKSSNPFNLNKVTGEITFIYVDENKYEFFVGTKQGHIYAFDIEI